MHLKTMGFDGLEVKLPEGNLLNFSKNETIIIAQTNESRIISPMIQQLISKEIGRDVMLKKALNVIVSYFCIGTELRFLA